MIGETIGNFKIVSRLGRGGMGEVYAGEHEKIQTRVAIKVLHREISRDTEHVQRFFNEAKIVGRIKHSGIVKIFDVGFFKDHAYLVMELLEGELLSARIERSERIAWREAVDIGRQIASALDATHRAGVIHRDLKPENIFVVADHELASGERVKILDFGISKLTGTLESGSPRTVGTMGTPTYMAPEQWGDSGKVGWEADAYSLGCVVFEMLCGRPPFEVKTIAEACAKHLHTTPPAPHEFVEGLPVALDELIVRLLAKQPTDRAVSMGQIASELGAIASGHDGVGPSSFEGGSATPPRSSTTEIRSKSATPATMTTLGSTASEIEVPRRSGIGKGALVGIAAAAAILVVVVIAMTRSAAPTAAETPPSSSLPAAVVPVPPDAASPQVVSPPPDAARQAPSPDAAVAEPAGTIVTPKKPLPNAGKPKVPPPGVGSNSTKTVPAPAGSGSMPPPPPPPPKPDALDGRT